MAQLMDTSQDSFRQVMGHFLLAFQTVDVYSMRHLQFTLGWFEQTYFKIEILLELLLELELSIEIGQSLDDQNPKSCQC